MNGEDFVSAVRVLLLLAFLMLLVGPLLLAIILAPD